MSEWTKMSERKPDIGSRILIFDGFWPCIATVGANDFGQINLDCGDYCIGYDDPQEVEDYVKYWMPLPEPPKGD